jgi:hypothetical protein
MPFYASRAALLLCSFFMVLSLHAQPAARPAWLVSKPTSQTHYIGIGSAQKTQSDFRRAAKSNALQDLLSEIKITVSSTSVLSQMENSSGFKSEYESVVKTSAADNLQNFELVESYEDADNFYMYYRLAKSEYTAQSQRNMESAKRMAIQFYEKAIAAEKTDNLTTAIDFYFRSLLALKDYWNEPLEVQVQGKPIYLAVESYARVQQALDKIFVKSAAPSVRVNVREQPTLRLTWQITDAAAKPLGKIPVTVSLLPQRTSPASYLSDEKGNLVASLSSQTITQAGQEVEALVDLKNFSRGNADDKFYGFLLRSLRAPSQKISLDVQGLASVSNNPMRRLTTTGDFFPFNLDFVKVDFANADRYTFRNLRLVPIRTTPQFRDAIGAAGYYISLQTAMDSNLVAVNEVSSSGQVNTLLIRNLSRDTLFVMSGEVLIGGKQDRVVASDMLIAPNSGQVKLPVFCVEKGRWKMKGDGEQKFTEYYGMANEHLRNLIDHRKTQGDIWNEVAKTNKKDHTENETDAYTEHARNKDFRNAEQPYLSHFQTLFDNEPDVIGVIAISGNQVEGCDMFISNRLFRQEFRKLIYSYLDDALTYGGAISISNDVIERYANQLLTPDTQRQFIEEKGQAFRRGGQTIHISVY